MKKVSETVSLKSENGQVGTEVYCAIVDKQQITVTKTWQGIGMYFIKVYNEQNNVVAVKKIILE